MIHMPTPVFAILLCTLTAGAAEPPRARWTPEEAWAWYKAHPWMVGFNFVPSTAANTTEIWQAESFDEPTIDRELGLAAGLGFNTCRIFIQYIVWKHDPDGLRKRFDRFLEVADRHGISTVPVPFDDCAFGDPPQTEPYLGKQRDLIPGMIGPSWTPSPGLGKVVDRSAWPDLERYVRELVGAFGRDDRVLFWDLYNEPGNSGMGSKSLPLVEASFAWARAAAPRQPLTVGIWSGMEDLNRRQVDLSDVISFHFYGKGDDLRWIIAGHKGHGRPVICTEWMARLMGSRWDTDLPLFRREGVGCYSWGLVNGRMQCQFPWWSKRGDPEPALWFHDLFRKDGTPYDPAEHEVIRRVAADKKIDFAKVDLGKPQLAPGEVPDTDPRFRWSAGWTAWRGGGPPWGSLHYANAAGSSVEVAFEGTSVLLLHKVGPDCGVAEVRIDGKPAVAANGGCLAAGEAGLALLDTFGADVDWCRRTPVARGLPAGRHVLEVRVTGKKDARSSDTYVQVVGIQVAGG